jgi:acyl transferase domain-containing protein/acyl carrier protein
VTYQNTNDHYGKIAVVGMSGRYPGSKNLKEFWDNIVEGKDCISRFTTEEIIASGVPAAQAASPNYVGSGGVYQRPFDFDAAFFGYNPREAELMDPQHRVFLEYCWNALEHAGYDSTRYPGRIGVYGGCGVTNYLFQIITDQELMRNMDPYAMMTTNDRDFLATRVGYKLDLRGPCVTVQTACSTSMVAVTQGAQSLLNFHSDMVLAGGVSINASAKLGYEYTDGGITSPDGLCRTFDASAKGTVWAAGVGVVVLKRLEDAIADGDTIHAVMLGFGMSNDGSARAGFTAPGVEGQVLATLDALSMADVNADSIDYVECHGTGTPIGDPIEITALTKAYRKSTKKRGYCAVASVKTNIGHADAAAGVAGLIKAVFALEHRKIPASLNYAQPNPQINFDESPFFVNTELKDWPAGPTPRRVGINSFGMGGTNAHVILEEAPPQVSAPSARPAQLLVWSARSPAALQRMSDNLAAHLSTHAGVNLADAAYTLQNGRRRFSHRRAFVAGHGGSLTEATSDIGISGAVTVQSERQEAKVSFLFPGQGAQHPNMARALYDAEPRFQATVDFCCEHLKAAMGGFDLRSVLFPAADAVDKAAAVLSQTAHTQPALFVIEYALARLLIDWGIKPEAMIGHSVGEYAAACIADVLSVGDALNLIALRGRLIQALPTGAMTSILAPVEQVSRLLNEYPDISIAAINAPATCVVSGPVDSIERFEMRLAEREIPSKRLQTSHAFHSAMMDPACASFRDAVAAVPLHAPKIRYLSNLTGTWITERQATDPDYWVDHLRNTVQFSAGIGELIRTVNGILLEVGPGTSLTGLVNQHPNKADAVATYASLPSAKDPHQDAYRQLLLTLGRLWCEGVTPDWSALHAPEERRRIPLPTYSFDHQSYRIAFNAPVDRRQVKLEDTPKRTDIAEWCNVTSWTRAPVLSQLVPTASSTWLIFADREGLGQRLASRIRSHGAATILVTEGDAYRRSAEDAFTLRAGAKEDYLALIKELKSAGSVPTDVVHLWGIRDNPGEGLSPESIDAGLEPTFYSLLFLAAALGSELAGTALRLHTVSANAQNVLGAEPIAPLNSTVSGPTKALSREQSAFHSHWIDVSLAEVREAIRAERLARDVLGECLAGCDAEVIAYRNGHRWLQGFEPLRLEEPAEPLPRLRAHGVYLIPGGLGGIGLAIARFLAERLQASLVLISRSAVPAREDWSRWLTTRGEHDRTSGRIREIMALESLGARVLPLAADVADADSMRRAVRQAKEKFGVIHGVINASGVAGKGMMELKTRETAAAVLKPKIHGTVLLDAVLKDEPLDFFITCSSLLGVLSEVGQADYCSANAFVGAFSHAGLHRGRVVPFAIDWDRWDEVGMAVDSIASQTTASSAATAAREYHEIGHHLFDALFHEGEDIVYVVHLDANKHWLVAEHYLSGQPAMVGTGYVECARSAFVDHSKATQVEIRDLVFTGALMLAQDERREMQVRLKHDGAVTQFVIRSLLPGGSWQNHAMGKIAALDRETGEVEDLQAIRDRCTAADRLEDNGEVAQPMRRQTLVKVSERWSCMESTLSGNDEALAMLALPKEYLDDLRHYGVHPALLDTATAFPVQFASRGASYLPFSYNRVRILRPMTPRIASYARFRPAKTSTDEFLSFDVLITDERGAEILRIEGYGMKRVGNVLAPARELGAAPGRSAVEDLQLGSHLLTHEGIEVFRRALALEDVPQVEISTKGLEYYTEVSRKKRNRVITVNTEAAAAKVVRYPRPSLSMPYVAARTPIEEAIIGIWQEVIGLDQVGVLDDFTELGGHSLLAIQLTSRVRQQFDIEMSVATFYNQPTPEGMALAMVDALVGDVDEEALALALESVES